MNPVAGDPPSLPFFDLSEASRLSGLTPHRIRALVNRGQLEYRGSRADPFFLLEWLTSISVRPPGEDSAIDAGLNGMPTSARTEKPAQELLGVRLGHVLDVTRTMPDELVQCVVTSPPFWGQRVYADEVPVVWADGSSSTFGRERFPEDYVRHTAEILNELARVLKPRGTIWWNLGDTYMTRTIMRTSSSDRVRHYGGSRTKWAGHPDRRSSAGHPFLKDKDLALIPFRVALVAQQTGLWVRSIIVWSKQPEVEPSLPSNGSVSKRTHVPEPVDDRPVTGHEYVLLMSKNDVYDYYPPAKDGSQGSQLPNARTVWSFRPVHRAGIHGARFPEELPRRCIELGSQETDLVFDPFVGQGTTLKVAKEMSRRYFGCDISPTYAALASELLSSGFAGERRRGDGIIQGTA